VSQRTFYDDYPITSILLLLIAGFFALEMMGSQSHGAELAGGFDIYPVQPQVALDLGSSASWAIRDGEWWRLLASVFLHAGAIHLICNLSVLLYLGRVCEPRIASAKFFTVFVASGLGGSLASFGWRVLRGTDGHSVGASGALAGLIGMMLIYAVKERDQDLRNDVVRWVVFLVLFSFFLPVDNLGHLGGFVVGCVLGLTVKQYTTSGEARLWRIPAWICGGLVATSLGFAVWHHGSSNWDWNLVW